MPPLSDATGGLRKSRLLSGTDIRERMGFPRNANRWVSLLVYPAMTPILVLRRKVGVRMVSISRLVTTYLFLLVWGLVVGGAVALVHALSTEDLPSFSDVMQGLVADQVRSQLERFEWLPESVRNALAAPVRPPRTYQPAFDAFRSEFGRIFVPLIPFGLFTMVIGLIHRVVRWVARQGGEQLNTKALGISWIPLPIVNNSIERYLDPLLCLAIGCAAFAFEWRLIGAWIMFCAFALAIVEKYVHEIQLDQYDALLNAEAHEHITNRYLNGIQKHSRGGRSARPIATGMSQDVKDRMADRLRRQSVHPAHVGARPLAEAADRRAIPVPLQEAAEAGARALSPDAHVAPSRVGGEAPLHAHGEQAAATGREGLRPVSKRESTHLAPQAAVAAGSDAAQPDAHRDMSSDEAWALVLPLVANLTEASAHLGSGELTSQLMLHAEQRSAALARHLKALGMKRISGRVVPGGRETNRNPEMFAVELTDSVLLFPSPRSRYKQAFDLYFEGASSATWSRCVVPATVQLTAENQLKVLKRGVSGR